MLLRHVTLVRHMTVFCLLLLPPNNTENVKKQCDYKSRLLVLALFTTGCYSGLLSLQVPEIVLSLIHCRYTLNILHLFCSAVMVLAVVLNPVIVISGLKKEEKKYSQ